LQLSAILILVKGILGHPVFAVQIKLSIAIKIYKVEDKYFGLCTDL